MSEHLQCCELRAARATPTVSFSGHDRGELGHATRGEPVEGGRGLVAGWRVGAFVACMLVVAACSSGGNAPPPTTEVEISSSAPKTTAVTTPVSTSPSPSTTETPTTPAVHSTIPTTIASTPSTTPADPSIKVEADVRAAVDRAIADFSACLLALPNCDPTMLATSRANPMLALNAGRISEWNLAGYSVIDRDQFRYVIESVDLADDLATATVIVCVADGSKLIHAGAGPGGADVIIDGTFVSGREQWDVRLDPDGVWRAHDAPAVGPTEGIDVCPPA